MTTNNENGAETDLYRETRPGNSKFGPCESMTPNEFFSGKLGERDLVMALHLLRKLREEIHSDLIMVRGSYQRAAASLGVYDLYREKKDDMTDVSVKIKT